MSVSRLRFTFSDNSLGGSRGVVNSPVSPALSPDSIPITPRRQVGAFTVQYANRARNTACVDDDNHGTNFTDVADPTVSSRTGIIRTDSGPYKPSASSPLGRGEAETGGAKSATPLSSFQPTTSSSSPTMTSVSPQEQQVDSISPSSVQLEKEQQQQQEKEDLLFFDEEEQNDTSHPPIIELEPPTPEGVDKNLESPFGSFISNSSSTGTPMSASGCGLTEGSTSFRTPSSLGGSLRKTPRHAIRPLVTFRPDLNRKEQEEQVKLEKNFIRLSNNLSDAKEATFLAGFGNNIDDLTEADICGMKYRLLALIACSHHFQAQLRLQQKSRRNDSAGDRSSNTAAATANLSRNPAQRKQPPLSNQQQVVEVGSLRFTHTLLNDVVSMFDHCMRSRDVRSPQEGAAIAFQHTVAEFNKIGLWRLPTTTKQPQQK